MALYEYKAVTRDGKIVRNQVDELNKYILMKKLKNSNLLPISITSINIKRSNKSLTKKNIETKGNMLKSAREQGILSRNEIETRSFGSKIKSIIYPNSKIRPRDVVIFTQNLYLLKKANFNNIHALSTVIETAENPSLRAIIEDILLGVEAGENIYVTMERYADIFPPIYINMIKVGEMSRFTYKSFRTGS